MNFIQFYFLSFGIVIMTSEYTNKEIIEESVSNSPDNMYVLKYKMLNWFNLHKAPTKQYCIIHDYVDKKNTYNTECTNNYLQYFKNNITRCNCNRCYFNSNKSSTGISNNTNYCTLIIGLCSVSTTLIASGLYLFSTSSCMRHN